jgi:hypothetical protein
MIFHTKWGLHYGYPLCCILRFAVERVVNPRGEPARERGVRYIGDPGEDHGYVPCNLFHRKMVDVVQQEERCARCA